MKKTITPLSMMMACLVLFAFTTIQGWQIKEGYHIEFDNNDVYGIFKSFEGTLVFDEQNLEGSKFDIRIDVASINTGNGLRNESAKGEDWFDIEKYPEIMFSSSSITKTGTGYQTTGILQIREVKKEITFPFEYQANGSEGSFKGNFSVNRIDYRLGSPEEEVDHMINVQIFVPVTRK